MCAGALDELRLLARPPMGNTKENPALNMEQTPIIFEAFIGLLFVRIAHNLPLESCVSLLARVERNSKHPRCSSWMLEHLWMYKARSARAKVARRVSELCSHTQGAQRAVALECVEQTKGGR